MPGEYQLHGEKTHPVDRVSAGLDDHSRRCSRSARTLQAVDPFNLNDTEPARARGRQIGVITKMRDVDAGAERCFQDCGTCFCFNLAPVYRQSDVIQRHLKKWST